ncbi:MAG: endonuclease/exonuclease/phosphatase family protein [Gemmataceae bacterium]
MELFQEHKAGGDAKSPRSAEPRRLRRGVAVCSWLYFLIVLAVWAAIHAGDLWWPATLLLFSPRWLLAIPLLPLSLAAARWRRRSLAPVLLALFLILGPIMSFHVPWRAAVSPAPLGEHLRVFTCNIHYHKPHRAALEQLLTESEPDVVAVQELPSREPFGFFAAEQWHLHRTRSFFLASRYPIRKATLLGDKSMKMPGSIMRYELDTPASVVTLFSLHFASPRDGLYQATHHPATGILELEDNSDMRRRQSENLVSLADEVTGPVLLMGDFNTPSESAFFHRVWDRYTDAFTQAGWGWGYTFFGAKTTVRIDHILAGPGWYCERCWVGANIGSPHRPILADVILSEPRP